MAERAYSRRRLSLRTEGKDGSTGYPVSSDLRIPPPRGATPGIVSASDTRFDPPNLGKPAGPLGAAGAFEVIDLNTHPDGALLRLVVQATKLFDSLALGPAGPRSYAERGVDAVTLMALYDEIAAISAVTADGWHAKATFACLYDGLGMTRSTVHAVAYSALRDAIRLGVAP